MPTSVTLHLVSLTQGLSLNLAFIILARLAGQQALGSLFSPFLGLRFKVHIAVLDLDAGAGDLNSGPYADTVNTLNHLFSSIHDI